MITERRFPRAGESPFCKVLLVSELAARLFFVDQHGDAVLAELELGSVAGHLDIAD